MIVAVDPGKGGGMARFTNRGELREWHKFMVPGNPRYLQREHLDVAKHIARNAKVYILEAQDDRKHGRQAVQLRNTQNAVWGQMYAIGALFADEVVLVGAQYWKPRMGLSGRNKQASLALARELYPDAELTKGYHHDVAEAILMGVDYGREHLNWKI